MSGCRLDSTGATVDSAGASCSSHLRCPDAPAAWGACRTSARKTRWVGAWGRCVCGRSGPHLATKAPRRSRIQARRCGASCDLSPRPYSLVSCGGHSPQNRPLTEGRPYRLRADGSLSSEPRSRSQSSARLRNLSPRRASSFPTDSVFRAGHHAQSAPPPAPPKVVCFAPPALARRNLPPPPRAGWRAGRRRATRARSGASSRSPRAGPARPG
jgi:hypothetical protein